MENQEEKVGKHPISAAAWAYISLKLLQPKKVVLPRKQKIQELIGVIGFASKHLSS